MPTKAQYYALLNIKADLLPEGASNRGKLKLSATHVTIHDTGNTSKGADALAHAKYIKGEAARKRNVSWHYTVDDTRAVKHLPLSVRGKHAGSAEGNRVSIGIECCVDAGGDREATAQRAAVLTAVLCFEEGIPLGNVVTHRSWSGKDCPATFFDGESFADWKGRVGKILSDLQDGDD